MITLKKTYYLLFLLPLINACVEPAELDLQEPSKIVLLSQQFYPGEPLQVIVAQSQPLFTGGNSYINNADVSIFKNDELVGKLRRDFDTEGVYGTNDNIIPEEGATYKISVEADGLPVVNAEDRVPPAVRIRALEIPVIEKQINENKETEVNFKVDVVISDPANKANYYHLSFYQFIYDYVLLGRDTIRLPFPTIVSPTIVQSNVNDPFRTHPEGGGMITDELFNGEIKTLSFNGNVTYNKERKIPGELVVELRTVTSNYYHFFDSLQRQSQSSGNFNITAFDDPTSVFTNIENGFGVFAGYSYTVESIELK